MHIGLDARTIFDHARRGIGKSLLSLYQQLTADRPDWRFTAYCRTRQPDENLFPGNVRVRSIEMLGDRFDAWQRFRLPYAAKRDGVDVLHCPANSSPSWVTVPMVSTVHDLNPIDRQDKTAGQFEAGVKTSIASSELIHCPSEYTRQRLIDRYGLAEHRVWAMPWGSTVDHEPITSVSRTTMDQYGVQFPFVLHFGARQPRKNTLRLIEAWSCIPAHVRSNWRLIVVGLDESTINEWQTTCERLGVTKSVRLNSYAPENELKQLLAAAQVLAYPSMAEGFGLPILEAFAQRTAVLTSDRTSLPEIAGDAAVLVDPTDTQAMSRSLTLLMKDVPYRLTLIERGTNRLEQFTWQATANRFADFLTVAATGKMPSNLPFKTQKQPPPLPIRKAA